jgi:hypothetical protein
MAVTHDTDIRAVIGQSGQGKGVRIKEWLAAEQPARVIVWDPMREHESTAPAAPTLRHALGILKRAGADDPVRVRYVPKGGAASAAMAAEFRGICELALAAGNAWLIVEELSFVTSPSHAPASWARVCNAGRHVGLTVIGSSQAPAQIDKAFLGNATQLVCFYLQQRPHRQAVASVLDIDADRIKALAKFQYLGFERDARAVTLCRVATPWIPGSPPGGPVAV